VLVTDSLKFTRGVFYLVAIDPAVTVGPAALPAATIGNRYGARLTAAGGSGQGYNFTAIGLPSWLTLSRDGLLSGTPPTTALAQVRFTVRATDNLNGSGTASYVLAVDPALTLSPAALPAATAGAPFRVQLKAAGGSGTGYDFTGTGLPSWLTLSGDGLLTGTPLTNAGSPFGFTVTVTDSIGGTRSQAYSLTVHPPT
jgi:hypothetical protein